MFWMRARITLKPLLCFSFSSICRNVLFPRRILCNPFPASKSLWCLILSLSISPWKLLLPCHTFPIRFVLRICCWVNSHHLAAWFCIDKVQRNYFLVIQKRIRVKKKNFWSAECFLGKEILFAMVIPSKQSANSTWQSIFIRRWSLKRGMLMKVLHYYEHSNCSFKPNTW